MWFYTIITLTDIKVTEEVDKNMFLCYIFLFCLHIPITIQGVNAP